MQLAQDISSMTLALRKKENIKVRQPLTQIMVPILSDNEQENIEAVKDLIMNEVNVKAINFVTDASGILVKRIKPDFKKLGPKCGKNMKTVAQMLTEFSQAITAGSRNATLSQKAGKLIKRYGDTAKAEQLFKIEAQRCVPPLSEDELTTRTTATWSSWACRASSRSDMPIIVVL